MASNLLKTFEKIERGRLKCIQRANQKQYQLPDNASLEQIANCIDYQANVDVYTKDYRSFLTGDFTELEDGILKIPADITKLGPYTFYKRSIKNVIWPERLEEIGNYCFDGVTTLTDITIPETVNKIGSYAFANLISGNYEINIPSNVTTIGTYAFQKSYARQINYDGRATSISQYAFAGSGSTLATNNKVLMTEESIAVIDTVGSRAFEYTQLERSPIQSNVKSIGEYAFNYSTIKSESVLNVTSLSNYAFAYANFKKPITWLQSPYSINTYTFNNATFNQDELIIPANVRSIGTRAFQGISTSSKTNSKFSKIEFLYVSDENGNALSLNEGVLMPAYYENVIVHAKKVTFTSGSQFASQNGGNYIFLNLVTVPTIGTSNTFNLTNLQNTNAYVYLPDDLVETAKTMTNWSTIKARIKPLSQWSGYAEYAEHILPRGEA